MRHSQDRWTIKISVLRTAENMSLDRPASITVAFQSLPTSFHEIRHCCYAAVAKKELERFP